MPLDAGLPQIGQPPVGIVGIAVAHRAAKDRLRGGCRSSRARPGSAGRRRAGPAAAPARGVPPSRPVERRRHLGMKMRAPAPPAAPRLARPSPARPRRPGSRRLAVTPSAARSNSSSASGASRRRLRTSSRWPSRVQPSRRRPSAASAAASASRTRSRSSRRRMPMKSTMIGPAARAAGSAALRPAPPQVDCGARRARPPPPAHSTSIIIAACGRLDGDARRRPPSDTRRQSADDTGSAMPCSRRAAPPSAMKLRRASRAPELARHLAPRSAKGRSRVHGQAGEFLERRRSAPRSSSGAAAGRRRASPRAAAHRSAPARCAARSPAAPRRNTNPRVLRGRARGQALVGGERKHGARPVALSPRASLVTWTITRLAFGQPGDAGAGDRHPRRIEKPGAVEADIDQRRRQFRTQGNHPAEKDLADRVGRCRARTRKPVSAPSSTSAAQTSPGETASARVRLTARPLPAEAPYHRKPWPSSSAAVSKSARPTTLL